MTHLPRLLAAILLSIGVLTLTACEAARTVNVDVTSQTELEGNPLGNAITSFVFADFASFDVSSSATFENNDATKANIGESFVTGFVLKVKTPDDQTLSFMDNMEVYIGDGNTRTRVAYIADTQNTDVMTLELQVYDEREIGQYLRAEETVVDIEVNASPPNRDTTIEATMSFEILLQF